MAGAAVWVSVEVVLPELSPGSVEAAAATPKEIAPDDCPELRREQISCSKIHYHWQRTIGFLGLEARRRSPGHRRSSTGPAARIANRIAGRLPGAARVGSASSLRWRPPCQCGPMRWTIRVTK